MDLNLLVLYEISGKMQNQSDEILISSSELAAGLDVSQQTASRYLKALESDGLIKRRIVKKGQVVSLTEKGTTALKEVSLNLKGLFEGKRKGIVITGSVISGLGEGAYYVRQYQAKIVKALGMQPYPGTLNVRISQKLSIGRYASKKIKGFVKAGRTFGEIHLIRARLSKDDGSKKVNCHILMPKRTHHRDVLEILGEKNLREILGLKDGDKVKIEILS